MHASQAKKNLLKKICLNKKNATVVPHKVFPFKSYRIFYIQIYAVITIAHTPLYTCSFLHIQSSSSIIIINCCIRIYIYIYYIQPETENIIFNVRCFIARRALCLMVFFVFLYVRGI